MNFKKIMGLTLAVVVLATSLTGCDLINQFLPSGDNGGSSAGKNTLIMEAEYINIDNVAGAGISNNNSGLSMIYGNGSDAEKEMWSGGYYVGYTHNDQCVMEFKFTASKATTANISIDLGCELQDMVFDSESFAVEVNGVAQMYGNWDIQCSEMDKATFKTCRLAAPVQLVEGENTITLKVLSNDIGGEGVTRGPLVDFVKVVATDAELSWEPCDDNPYRRDNEV